MIQDNRVRCIDCRYNHPRFCGYAKLREEGKPGIMPEDGLHGCREFSVGRPPERDQEVPVDKRRS